jgi:antirestriction protein ArdC
MKTDQKLTRKEKTKILVQKLNALSEEDKAKLSSYLIRSITGKPYSQRNQMLIAWQAGMDNLSPTICGGFKQWLEHGRAVKKGEHGAYILYPVGNLKEDDPEEEAEPTHFFSAVVFDISQTEELKEIKENES